MLAFLKDNQKAILWLFGIIIPSALFYLSLHFGLKKVIERGRKRGYSDFSLVKLIVRILKLFTILFVLLFLTFFLVDEKYFSYIKQNIRIIIYLSTVAIFTIVTAAVSNTLFKRTINRKIAERGNPTSYKFLNYVTTLVIYTFGILLAVLAFPALKGVAKTALGGAGILAVIIGVASQEALANLVGGFFIIIFRPFQVNDIIKVNDNMMGEVMDITLRHTIIKNYQNKMIVIPNAIINKEKVMNYNLGDKKCCQWIEIGISYDSDLDKAKEIIRDECEQHPNLTDPRTPQEINENTPKVAVRVIDLGESAVTLRAWAWAKDYPSAFNMKCDLFESIKKRFDKEGIEIPYPHRTLVVKSSSNSTSATPLL